MNERKRASLPPSLQADNVEAGKNLTPGADYAFDPIVASPGVPVDGSEAIPPILLHFTHGQYVGFHGDEHVFRGRPTPDPRELDDDKRDCHFRVALVTGASATRVHAASAN